MTNKLDLFILGSGNAFAKGRYWSSFLLNGRYLFDASPVVAPHLKMAGISPNAIDTIFISHFHADHFFGLPFLLLDYALGDPRSTDLTIVGPPGIEERLGTLTDAGFPNLLEKADYRLTFIEAEDRLEGETAGLKFVARSVSHVESLEAFGYRVETGGRTLAYSGDTMICDAVVELADGADVFVVECSCWDDDCGPHMSPDDVRELRRRLGPKPQFLLTHLDEGERDLGIENTLLASDLAKLSL